MMKFSWRNAIQKVRRPCMEQNVQLSCSALRQYKHQPD